MRRLFLVAALLLVPSLARAQVLTTQGKTAGVIIKDEGTVLGGATALNCSGSAITCTQAGGVATLSVSSGSGNFVAVTVDFSSSGAFDATKVVTGQAWVTASSIIICSATAVGAGTRATDADDVWLENFTANVYARVAGTGFTLKVRPQAGLALGQYVFHCTGA